LLTESTLLALAGGIAGAVFAVWGLDVLLQAAPAQLRRVEGVRVNFVALGFTLTISIVTGILFGLAPTWHVVRRDLAQALVEREQSGRLGSGRVRNVLMAGEVALAMILLTGAGLMVRTIAALYNVNPGFDTSNLLSMEYNLAGPAYREDEKRYAFHRDLVTTIASLPGVKGAALTLSVPIDGSNWGSVFVPEGRPLPERKNLPTAAFAPVSPEYFQVMGIRLNAGRAFSENDDSSSPEVIIVNQTMARRMWPGESPLGKRIKQGFPEWKTPWREVVGVVADVKVDGLDDSARMQVYMPIAQNPEGNMRMVVRAAANPMLLRPAIERSFRSLDKDLPVYGFLTMSEIISSSVAERRFAMLLLGCFAGLALILAAVGIYGVISYSVVQRTREIGIRVALGASTAQVLKNVIGAAMVLVGVGLAAGLAGSLALTRWMSKLLYGVKSSDPPTLAIVSALLAICALAACIVPARRALRIDPVEALRQE
jgi:putative ABC transport system permease protein